MDTTIRNLDEQAYRQLKARAATLGKTIGELVSEAIRGYLLRPEATGPARSLAELVPESYGDGSERTSDEIDSIVYGI